MIGALFSLGLTAAEAILGTIAGGTTLKIGYDSYKNGKDPEYHLAQAKRAETAKNEAAEKKAKKEADKATKEAQKIAISILKSKPGVFDSLKNFAGMFKS